MTLISMVICADGESRPESECLQVASGDWLPANEVVRIYSGESHPREACVRLEYGGRWALSDDEDLVTLACGGYGLYDESTSIGGEWYDSEECTACGICEEVMLNDDSYGSPDGGSLCEHCCSEHTCSCEGCSERIWTEDAHWDDDADGYYCRRCSERVRTLIKSYGDKSANNKRPESKDKLLFGVELEVEHKTDAETGAVYASGFLDRDYVTFKRDGSLGHTGFEIVTRPDSMEVHKRKFKAMFDDKPGKQLTSWSNGRCGMHVHITKSAMSQLQLGKLLCFLNEPANTHMISKIAGRKPGRWCRAYKKKITDVRYADDRYVALNITSKTAEVRIFRGTLSQPGFFKNLEFVQALVEFCAPANRGIREAVSAKEFCKWLPRRQYPTLHKFLVERGFIVWNHKKKAA